MFYQATQFLHQGKQPAQFVAASLVRNTLIAFPNHSNLGDEQMTASIQNANSSFHILDRTLRQLDDLSAEEKLWHLEHLLDSLWKCLKSQSAQIRFYESAKHTGRALLVENGDGSHDVISGQRVEALRLPLPNLQEDAVIFGNADALKMVAVALSSLDWPSDGPAQLTDLANQLAEKANPPDMEARSDDTSVHGQL